MKSKKWLCGLSGFDLKCLAMILMVLDHIHYFFDFTGRIPLLFSQLGRLSGWLFLFCTAEGFAHTSNRRRYVLRCYHRGRDGLDSIGDSVFRLDAGRWFFPSQQHLRYLSALLPFVAGVG